MLIIDIYSIGGIAVKKINGNVLYRIAVPYIIKLHTFQ